MFMLITDLLDAPKVVNNFNFLINNYVIKSNSKIRR